MAKYAVFLSLVIAAYSAEVVGADDPKTPAAPLTKLTPEQRKAQLAESNRLDQKFTELYKAGKYREASVCAQQVLEISKSILGNEHPDTAASHNNLGAALQSQGDYAGARSHFEQALTIQQKVLEANHLSTANTHNSLGVLLMGQSEYARARPHFALALKIRQNALGEEHPSTATVHNNLGMLLQAQGDYAEARSHLEQALKTVQKGMGDHPNTAASHNSLGSLFLAQGDYAAARPHFEQSLRIMQKLQGEEHPNTATAHSSLGAILLAQGDNAAARVHLEQALKISKKALGDEHANTAVAHNNLGSLLMAQGDYVAARLHIEQGLRIKTKVFGEEHLETAAMHNALGALLHNQDDYAAARLHYDQALRIWTKVLGEEHPETARGHNNLGTLFQTQRDYIAARSHYDQALRIRTKVLGEEHPDTAKVHNNLGSLLKAQGDYVAARFHIEQALRINTKVLGADHPDTVSAEMHLGAFEAEQENMDTAGKLFDKARRSSLRHVSRVLASLSEKEQLLFLKSNEESNRNSVLSLGLEGTENQALINLSAAWLLNGKALGHSALAARSLALRELQNPQLAPKVKELDTLRQQLATQSLKVPKPDDRKMHQAKLQELSDREASLSSELAQAIGLPTRTTSWIELDDLRKSLPVDGVLVDITRLKRLNFRAKRTERRFQADHYVAWVIPPAGAGNVQIVDLGLADPIDKAIEVARQSIAAAGTKDGTLQKEGERVAEEKVRKDLQVVADLVWRPLSATASNAKRLIVSPDGALWLLPWAALPVEENKFLIEAFPLQYVVSGRDLVGKRSAKVKSGPPMVLADPDFDATADKVLTVLRSLFPALPWGKQMQTRSLTNELSTLPKVRRLPGTAAEAQAIKSSLAKYAAEAPTTYTGEKALESITKLVVRPRVLVLSTHGFFLPDQETKQNKSQALADSDSRSMALTLDGKPIENPLLRCGLLLGGCNTPRSEGLDDGILTGMEVVGLDLRGTELVVLSACETGVGQVRNGEGVAGLRQAFQLAGAEAVVATLWQVPDQQSGRLMSEFFLNLAGSENKTDALRNAQLKQIAVRREKYGAAHPYFWAAFTITGK